MSGPSDSTKTGVIAISANGIRLAGKLAGRLSAEVVLHLSERYASLATAPDGVSVETFPLPLRPVLARLFDRYDRLVLFMPVGASVRLVAPLLQHKHHDPAVVCVDDGGRFAVSLVSGHAGGADLLAAEVAAILGAQPVITSASHVLETLAVDLLGQEFGWSIEADPVTVTRASAAVINGERVAVCQETGERDWWPESRPLPENLARFARLQCAVESGISHLLLVTDRTDLSDSGYTSPDVRTSPPGNVVVFRPRSLVVGMGCRRGVSREHLQGLLESTFAAHHLSTRCIKRFATASIKMNEPGLQELAQMYDAPLVCFEADELNGVFHSLESPNPEYGDVGSPSLSVRNLTPSAQARRLVGVWGVSEPAALLASGGGELLVTKVKTDRATMAVARITFQ